jgi:hypothetical protein
VLVDFAVHYIKANGQSRAKVFKLKTLELAAHATQRVGKQISLAEMTTRKHYPGVHRVEAILNGHAQALGSFDLLLFLFYPLDLSRPLHAFISIDALHVLCVALAVLGAVVWWAVDKLRRR